MISKLEAPKALQPKAQSLKPSARFFMFVNFFIRRPVFATVCALLIILAGAVVIPSLPISQFPNLAPPQISVTSAYTGASAQTVETAVTQPLEQQINGAEAMKYITSTSSSLNSAAGRTGMER